MSQAALQYINLVSRKPLINLEKLNPSLTAVVQDVAIIIKLRQKLIMMKKYLIVCLIDSILLIVQRCIHSKIFWTSTLVFYFPTWRTSSVSSSQCLWNLSWSRQRMSVSFWWMSGHLLWLSIIETASGLLLLVRDAIGREKRRNLLITDSVIYSTAILMKSNV